MAAVRTVVARRDDRHARACLRRPSQRDTAYRLIGRRLLRSDARLGSLGVGLIVGALREGKSGRSECAGNENSLERCFHDGSPIVE